MNEESNIESEQQVAKRVETSIEERESDKDAAADQLEKPPGGNFVAGLQGFISWLKDIFAKQK